MNNISAAVLGILGGFGTGICAGAKWVGKQYDAHCEVIERNADKFSDYYNVAIQWVKLHQSGKSINDYFEKKGYRRISIYGMNDMAHAMITELKETDTEIAFCIDRNSDNLFLEMKTFRPDEEFPNADVCVIALPDLYKDISGVLSKKMSCPIVSIEDVVWGI